MIFRSIISFCWETVPSDIEEKPINNSATAELLDEMDEKHYSPFFWIELMCILWFTIGKLSF